jgi:hypothetical protein
MSDINCGVVMSGEDALRPYLENLIVPEKQTNKQMSVKFYVQRKTAMLTKNKQTNKNA